MCVIALLLIKHFFNGCTSTAVVNIYLKLNQCRSILTAVLGSYIQVIFSEFLTFMRSGGKGASPGDLSLLLSDSGCFQPDVRSWTGGRGFVLCPLSVVRCLLFEISIWQKFCGQPTSYHAHENTESDSCRL